MCGGLKEHISRVTGKKKTKANFTIGCQKHLRRENIQQLSVLGVPGFGMITMGDLRTNRFALMINSLYFYECRSFVA